MARDGKIDPLIGREHEVERVVQILCRRRKNNPLLVGEAGVGKTAIAEGLAWRITQGEVPDVLADATVYALDMGALLAGTKYRGDFEQRLKGVLKQLKDQPAAILFIDEIHTLIGAGAASGGTLDASNLLKPALSSGAMKCIGATTFTEYRGIFEKDAALSRRFQKIDVVEPSVEQTIEILKGLKSRFEEHHSVKYALGALQAAAELSAKFINDRQLPDKAIDVIDEAGAAQRVLPKNKQKKTITRSEVEEIVAKIARIPPASVSNDDRSKLKSLDRDLNSVVFGQEPAIEALAAAIKMARSGLGKPDKPIGSFLFSGPTGVGKTEVARQLAYVPRHAARRRAHCAAPDIPCAGGRARNGHPASSPNRETLPAPAARRPACRSHRCRRRRAPERSSAWPGGTSPNTVMQMFSGPRVVSPPTSSQPCASASASRPREKPAPARPRRRAACASASVKASGSAPQAARSLRLTASALWPSLKRIDGGQKVAALDQHVATTPPAACRAPGDSSAQSSPMPSARARAGRLK